MKIAFVDNLPVGGGLSRFSYMLTRSLMEERPDIEIDYFAHATNIQRTPELRSMGGKVRLKTLEASRSPSFLRRGIRKAGLKVGIKPPQADPVIREIEQRVKGYDLAYFPSAHMMVKPRLDVPVAGTIHDFNWKYFFGQQTFSTGFVREMDMAVVEWINDAFTACSSYDVVSEAKKLYPGLKKHPKVVHLAPVSFSKDVEEAAAQKVLDALGIDHPYIIFPGNFYPHKNHLNLFTAFSILRQMPGHEELKLILTGLNTDQIAYGIAERLGVRLLTKSSGESFFDVRGLGYQPNSVIEALIKKARLLVSPSIYEAICTPGMDAWQMGTPTAISDIAPFREHEQVWGVRSAYFDPMNPLKIAETLHQYLGDYDRARENARISKENIMGYGWDKVARGYLSLFEDAIKQSA
ncbi:MAG TPA: glycosyltransferase [Puia sp.]|nr:glycosyltransferase [Puia sp.]